MTNTNLPVFPNTPRARTALRDLLDLARSYDEAVFLPGRAVENLIDAIRVIEQSIAAAAEVPEDAVLEDEVTRAQCHNCDLDIELWTDDGTGSEDWIDRGGNRRCPSGELHVPH